jgi:hypothetical protein
LELKLKLKLELKLELELELSKNASLRGAWQKNVGQKNMRAEFFCPTCFCPLSPIANPLTLTDFGFSVSKPECLPDPASVASAFS